MQGSGGESPAVCNCGKDDELAGGNPALASHAATARSKKTRGRQAAIECLSSSRVHVRTPALELRPS